MAEQATQLIHRTQVARAETARAVVREHARGVEVFAVQVAPHHMRAGNAQFAVLHKDLAAALGIADGQLVCAGKHRIVHHDPGGGHGGLGGAVGVDDARLRKTLPQVTCQRHREHLAAEQEGVERGQALLREIRLQ